MDPRRFLELAQSLTKESGNEAAIRTSVSRSYYALHNFISQFIEKQGFTLLHGADRHTWVKRDINACGDDFEIIASDLNDLREARNEADYDMGVNDFQNEQVAVMQFIKARAAYNDFQQFTDSKRKRAKIAKDIREYRKSINMPL